MRAKLLFSLLFLLIPGMALADALSLPALTVDSGAGEKQTYSVSLQILAVMTFLTLLPAVLMLMTSFTRIIVVLAILRQAIGMPQTPTNQILIGLALFLSLFIMAPVLEEANTKALKPYMAEKISTTEALERAIKPFRAFMIQQTREKDLNLFLNISGKKEVKNIDEVPLTILMPAFVTSELKTAFQIGFLLFLPFLIIDLVISSVLMSMGMMMLSPLIISLPFKVMLFVLVDGWGMVMGTLAASFMI